MTPYEQAVAIWAADGMDLPAALSFYERHGVVRKDPRFFIAAIPVRVADLRSRVFRPVPTADADCWFIGVRTGDITACWNFEPVALPFYAFQKRGKGLHIWPRARIRALTSRHLVAPIP